MNPQTQETQLNKETVPRWLLWAFSFFSFLGFLDASYLTAKHYTGGELNCSVFSGCEQVTTSVYSTIGPVPVSLLGAGFYLLVFLLSFMYLDSKKDILLRGLIGLSVIGFLASLAFVYLQVFIIKALCLYCLISATTSTTLFILSIFVVKLRYKQKKSAL